METKRRRPLTLSGRFFLIAAVICGHGLIDSSILPLLAYVTSLLLTAAFASVYFRPTLDGYIVQPPLGHVGDAVVLRVRLINRGNRPSYDLHVSLANIPGGLRCSGEEFMIDALAPGASIELEFEASSVRRGAYRLPQILAYSTFPFNLFRRSVTLASDGEICVAPAFDDWALSAANQNHGMEMSDHFGKRRANSSLEYVGSREYQPGTPVRRWDFTSWARIGTPTVCEFVEGIHHRAVVLVDLQEIQLPQTSLLRSDDCFEALLSRAASTIGELDREGFELQLILIGEEIQVTNGHGDFHQSEILFDRLARCGMSSRIHPAADHLVADAVLQSAEIFAVFSRIDEPRRAIIQTASMGVHRAHLDLIPDSDDQPDGLMAREPNSLAEASLT